MAFPVDADRLGTDGSTAATNKVCNLPANIVGGNGLILIIRSAGADTHTTPTGWTDLVKNDAADASNDTTSIFYKTAAGDEGSTVTVNGTASLKFAAAAWRITECANFALFPPEISAITTATTATPDPAAVTPAGGTKDYLFIWIGGWEGEQNTGSSPPAANVTNYSNKVGGASGTGGSVATNCQVAGCTRQLNGSTENPGSWNIVTSDDTSSWTIAINPEPDLVPLQAARGVGEIAHDLRAAWR